MVSEIDLKSLARRFVDFAQYVLENRKRLGLVSDHSEGSRFRHHVATARFAEKPVAEVSTRDLEEWLQELRAKDAQVKRRVRKLSKGTINRTRSLCSQILEAAVEAGLIATNPFTNVKPEPAEARDEDAWTYLTIDEQVKIANCTAIPEFDRLTILFAIGTGLSAGEQFNLGISDLHLDAEPPHVQVSVGSGGRAIPARTVDLLGPSAKAAARVMELLNWYAPENPDKLLFPTRSGTRRQKGKPLGRSNTFQLMLHKAGIHRAMPWKDLRRTCAVSMASGVWGRSYDLTDIARMLGYSNVHQAAAYAPFIDTQLGRGAVSKVRRPTYASDLDSTTRPHGPEADFFGGSGERSTPRPSSPTPATRNAEYTLADCARDVHKDEGTLARWVRAIDRKGQVILAGPPGTGKTFCAERLARHLMSGGTGTSELVQFHPSYGYEDFMEGIRPTAGPSGSLSYPLVPGRFVNFCRRASGLGRSVLIIDEINRANVARVFGELLYLLEYRTKAIPLAGGTTFTIPDNVVLIGTMNTADRSIALMDHALRRRFAFITLGPDMDSLVRFHDKNATGFDPTKLATVLRRINRTIDNSHYAIGVSFFMTTDLASDGVLEDIWRLEIEPHLDELFFDQPAKAEAFRWEAIEGELRS